MRVCLVPHRRAGYCVGEAGWETVRLQEDDEREDEKEDENERENRLLLLLALKRAP